MIFITQVRGIPQVLRCNFLLKNILKHILWQAYLVNNNISALIFIGYCPVGGIKNSSFTQTTIKSQPIRYWSQEGPKPQERDFTWRSLFLIATWAFKSTRLLSGNGKRFPVFGWPWNDSSLSQWTWRGCVMKGKSGRLCCDCCTMTLSCISRRLSWATGHFHMGQTKMNYIKGR